MTTSALGMLSTGAARAAGEEEGRTGFTGPYTAAITASAWLLSLARNLKRLRPGGAVPSAVVVYCEAEAAAKEASLAWDQRTFRGSRASTTPK